MKTRSLALISLIVFLYACAGGPGVMDEAPEWVSTAPADTVEQFAFRGMGEGDTLAAAKSDSVDSLYDAVVDAMNLGDPDRWSLEGQRAMTQFKDRLSQVVRTPEYSEMDGVTVVRKDGWFNPSGGITHAVDILWNKTAFENKAIELLYITGVASPEFRALEERARAAETDGNVYESALIWAAAAGIAEKDGNLSGYRIALRSIETILAAFEYNVESVPAGAYVGSRPADPVLFQVSSGGKSVGNAEFVITYPRSARDGTPARGEARLSSDNGGFVRFLPPEVAFAGTQKITIAPSADPFLEPVEDTANSSVDGFILSVESPAGEAGYEAEARLRSIPMGILVLETDLAGNPLDSDAAAGGLFDDLSADGFNVGVMDLDPREMISRTERALLRDIKADTRFSDAFDRVIHGTVSLESFEQSGDTFTVRVSGTLAMSDIDRQVTLFRSEISKSSRAASSQQAMTAAFRQLGRSFAEELIAQAP